MDNNKASSQMFIFGLGPLNFHCYKMITKLEESPEQSNT